jgi:hypothetical protein
LGGERAGRELRQRKPLQVIFFAYPAAVFYEIRLHVSSQSDRSAEADRSQT